MRLAFVVTVPAVRLAAVPEMFVPTSVVGLPSAGEVREGLVEKTASPDPVSSDNAADNCAEVKAPNTAAFPTEVTWPVKLALVVTFPAVNPEAVPVKLVATPDAGVPSAGVVDQGSIYAPEYTAAGSAAGPAAAAEGAAAGVLRGPVEFWLQPAKG